VQPVRLGLAYTAASGGPAVPYCIHRAPLGTHERFVAFLLEHFDGAFPTWLAPVQAIVIAVSEAQRDYASEIVRRLRTRFVRAELAHDGETVARNVRDAFERKIRNVIVVGAREQRDGSVTLRRRGIEQQAKLSVEELERRMLAAIERRLPMVEVGTS